jgi:SAM-dependent methyltransferase
MGHTNQDGVAVGYAGSPPPVVDAVPAGADSSRWDRFYSDDTYLQVWPRESVIRHLARRRRHRRFDRGLDFGCGIGRGCWLLHTNGIAAVGVDVSHVALTRAHRRVDRGDFVASLARFDGRQLPFADAAFDLVIADGVLDHLRAQDAAPLIREFARVLKPGGEVVATLASSRDPLCAELPLLEAGTALLQHGPEAGLVQRFFTAEDAVALLAPVGRAEVSELEEHFGPDPATLQWSRWTVAGYKAGADV